MFLMMIASAVRNTVKNLRHKLIFNLIKNLKKITVIVVRILMGFPRMTKPIELPSTHSKKLRIFATK